MTVDTALRLDLGSGRVAREGFMGVDKTPGVASVLYDLDSHPWPWADDSVAELHTSHFVEHVGDLVAFMNECHRILVPGGILTIRHPYQFSTWAWQDPTHRRALNEASWVYYDRTWREANGIDAYLGCTADFEVLGAQPTVIHQDYVGMDEDEFRKVWAHQVNVVYELTVELRKRA